jgi:hypothetical protein
MQFGDFQRFFSHIDAGGVCGAELGHAFGENAAAATHIEHGFAADAAILVDIAQAQRVDIVQGFEFAGFIPPFVGQLAEFVDFARVDIVRG